MRRQRFDRERADACLKEIVQGRNTITVSEAHRRVMDKISLDFSGPTIASYLKALGFERVREGVYQRSA